VLSVSPAQFRYGRSGTASKSAQDFLHSAQLRFDIHQSQQLWNVLPILAWTSLASIFPDKSGKLPAMQQLDFSSESQPDSGHKVTSDNPIDKILLPGGLGTFALNVSSAKQTSKLLSVLQRVSNASRLFNPVIGLPAISVAALQAFTALYSELEQRTTFLLSSLPAHFAVSQSAWNSPDRPATAMMLPPGDYLAFPKKDAGIVANEMDGLTIEGGYVVRRDAPRNAIVTERAQEAVKGLTYVTMRLSVTQALSGTETPTKK
jgi:hypothetical protein